MSKRTHISNLRQIFTKDKRKPFYTREQSELLRDVENPIVQHPTLCSYTPPRHSFSIESDERLAQLRLIKEEVNAVFETHEHNVAIREQRGNA